MVDQTNELDSKQYSHHSVKELSVSQTTSKETEAGDEKQDISDALVKIENDETLDDKTVPEENLQDKQLTSSQEPDTPAVKNDENIENEEQTTENEEQTIGNEEQTQGNDEQTLENEEQTLGNKEQTLGNEEQILGNEEQPLGNEEQILGNEEQPLGNEEQTLGNEEQTLGNKEQPLENEEQPLENEEQTQGNEKQTDLLPTESKSNESNASTQNFEENPETAERPSSVENDEIQQKETETEFDSQCKEYDTTASLHDAYKEQHELLPKLSSKSPMLMPIPEPDFSDLATKEKLFPRPALSNPKVCYELSCKQLNVVPIKQYLRSLDTYAEDLHLQSYGLARKDMLPLCLSLAYNTTAITLDLSNNRFEDNVLPSIQSMMNENSFIGSIKLSRNWLSGPGLNSLQVMLGNNYTLTSLELSHCRLLDADAPALAAIIEISINLRQLDLSHNELAECGKIFGTVLAADEGLEVLNLAWNTFRSKSARELLMGLRDNSRLRRLDLSWNSLGPDVAVAVRDLLRRNCTLAELDLAHNRLNDTNMKLVALGLLKNTTLEKIWIGHNPVTPVGALGIIKALSKVAVNYVDMSNIEVSSDFEKLKNKLDPNVITVAHGNINKDMVLIVPPQRKKR